MAGSKIYTGRMLESMEGKINDLQTDMGGMSADMQQMVVELIALKTVFGQGVSVLNVGQGNDFVRVFNESDLVITAGIEFGRYVCQCNGALFLKGSLKHNSGAGWSVKISVDVNGVSETVVDVTTQTQYVPFDKAIMVREGDLLVIGCSAQNGGPATLKAGMSLSYGIVDIVNDGALIVL